MKASCSTQILFTTYAVLKAKATKTDNSAHIVLKS